MAGRPDDRPGGAAAARGWRARKVYGADDAHSFLSGSPCSTRSPSDRTTACSTWAAAAACSSAAHSKRAARARASTTAARWCGLARATLGGAAPILQGNAEAMPFDDGAFTAVSCLVAFFFFADPVAVLREMRRVLDPERGRVAIMTTAPEAKGTPAAPYPLATRGHFYTDEELARLPLEAGFSSARLAHREPWAQLLVARP